MKYHILGTEPVTLSAAAASIFLKFSVGEYLASSEARYLLMQLLTGIFV